MSESNENRKGLKVEGNINTTLEGEAKVKKEEKKKKEMGESSWRKKGNEMK